MYEIILFCDRNDDYNLPAVCTDWITKKSRKGLCLYLTGRVSTAGKYLQETMATGK